MGVAFPEGVRQTSPLSVLVDTNALNQLSHFSCLVLREKYLHGLQELCW